MTGGYWGRIARVNLSSRTIKYEEQKDAFFRKNLGGVGLIAHYLYKELKPGTDALGEDNKLIFAPGIVTGARLPGASRMGIGAKSPLTGGLGKSEVGGFCGSAIKQAGLDAIIVEGIADQPVYLNVNKGQVEIRSANALWGKTTGEAQAIIREESGSNSVRTLLIGPAGENLVPIACVMSDLAHAAGRTGLGCVMGSKKLKGIAALGDQALPLHSEEELEKHRKWANQNAKELVKGLYDWGTGFAIEAYNSASNIPTKNFQDGFFDGVNEITPVMLKEKLNLTKSSCYACSVRCKKVVSSTQPLIEKEYGGPEYETLASFGVNCGISDIYAISKANALCNAYSLDTISTGVVIAFAMECFEKGIINEKTTGGLTLNFGNAGSMLRLIELIARKEGLGEILGQGVKKAADIWGQEARALAVHVKGLEMGMHEPRLKQGLGLGYAVAFQGADHGTGLHDTFFVDYGPKLNGINALGFYEPMPVDYLGPEKVHLFSELYKWRTFQDALVMCFFVPYNFIQTASIVRAITGWNFSVHEGIKAGERIINLARLFNLREGFSASDDMLPPRIFEPLKSGSLQGVSYDIDKLQAAVQGYYKIMGWDEKGVPHPDTLEAIGLGWAKLT